MRGAILPLPQYAFMAWCSVEAQGQLYFYLYLSSQCDMYSSWLYGNVFAFVIHLYEI
jgi:hypothetical protein